MGDSVEDYKKAILPHIDNWGKQNEPLGKQLSELNKQIDELEKNKTPTPEQKKKTRGPEQSKEGGLRQDQ